MIVGPLTSMLRTVNLSENLLTSVDVLKENEIIGGGGSDLTNKNLSKS